MPIGSIELENIAVSHPNVAEAAVIAARHPKWMERPLLIVAPKADCVPDTSSVLALYDGTVPRWWKPEAVLVVDALPHTATGKLDKGRHSGPTIMPQLCCAISVPPPTSCMASGTKRSDWRPSICLT